MTPNKVRVLTGRGADRADWLAAWQACGREPFAHPDYVALFAAEGDDIRCVTLDSAAGLAILPLILRSIGKLAWSDATMLVDATSPYGYGGPYTSSEVDLAELWSGVVEWMAASGVVTSFVRMALDAATPEQPQSGANVASDAMNIVVDLRRPEDDQWRHYEHKVRKNVNKANRAGLRVEVRESFTDLDEFAALYSATMDRRSASGWYYFDRRFFAALTTSLRGSYVAAEVRDEHGHLVSAELVLESDRYLYSFLGGTLREAFPHAPNDLLKHAVINYGRTSGRNGYVLGGGYTSDDGILRYKRSFDLTGSVPFSRMELVADGAAYRCLIDRRLAFERDVQPDAELPAGFFPRYRAPVISTAKGTSQ